MSDPGGLDPVPTEPPELHAAVGTFHAELRWLRVALAAMAELALELPPGFFDGFSEVDDSGLRMAHYPEQAEPPPPGQLRCGPHVDSGAVTIVSIDPRSPLGLEVNLDGGDGGEEGWSDVCERPARAAAA